MDNNKPSRATSRNPRATKGHLIRVGDWVEHINPDRVGFGSIGMVVGKGSLREMVTVKWVFLGTKQKVFEGGFYRENLRKLEASKNDEQGES